MKLKNSNSDAFKNFNCDETQKTQIVIKVKKNANCDDTQKLK